MWIRRDRLADVALVLVAILVLTIALERVLGGTDLWNPRQPRQVENWARVGLVGNRMGPENAPVTIVEFSDFECAYCARQVEVLKGLRQEFPDEVAVVYRHLPLPNHRFAREAAIAAECAAREGAFEAYHEVLFADREFIGKKAWSTFAEEVGIQELDDFETCLQEPEVAAAVRRDEAAAEDLGITLTPTLVINEQIVVGLTDQATLEAYVRAVLMSRDSGSLE